jgi:hypothetical protein
MKLFLLFHTTDNDINTPASMLPPSAKNVVSQARCKGFQWHLLYDLTGVGNAGL